VFNLSGHGYFDLSAYDSYLVGKLLDYAYPEEKIQASLAGLPSVPGA
jgi:tryptophan synthase beta chain